MHGHTQTDEKTQLSR